MTDLFHQCCKDIRSEYSGIGHKSSWRFLYTPRSTFSPKTKIVFIGLNPGGTGKNPGEQTPQPSVEEGNAYRIEHWAMHGQNFLQKQVQLFYRLMAASLPGSDFEQLMDDTLSANFCPFRSVSWERLSRKDRKVEFCHKLWRKILEMAHPEMIVTLGNPTRKQIDEVIKNLGYIISNADLHPCGWGNITYRIATAERNQRAVLLIGLPHLSRFKIFGRGKKADASFVPLMQMMRQHFLK